MIPPADIVNYVDLSFKILEIGSIVAGVALGLRQMGKVSAKTDATLERQNVVMSDMKEDIKALNKLITEVAVQTQRLNTLDQRQETQDRRIDMLDRRIDEVRHGDGFVRGPRGIDKEY